MGRIMTAVEFIANVCTVSQFTKYINIPYLILKSLFESKCHYYATLQVNKLRPREIK